MKKKIILLLTCLLHTFTGAEHGFWDSGDLQERKSESKKIRIAVAKESSSPDIADQKTNGDLNRYKDKRGSYSKGLVHKSDGMVEKSSFYSLIKALKSGRPNDFDAIILGGSRHLVNPQAAYAFSLEGSDAALHAIAEAPKLTSAQAASEMVELYWGALLRDVPFNKYSSDSIAAEAITDLNLMSNFRGPKQNGLVNSQTLWRGSTPGELTGPYISQFLYQPVPHFGRGVEQLYFSYLSGVSNNYLTTVNDLILVQNGRSTGERNVFVSSPHYIFTGRDLGTYVHKDYSTEAFMNAALILLGYGTAALDPNHPYKNNQTQDGFVTYGGPKVIELINTAASAALKACWYQKWMVHLRLRPEKFSFLVHEQIINDKDFGLHEDLLDSHALPRIFDLYGTYLLPQMYPEGSPTHPSYPSGHATIAGACVTILKAYFDENFVISNPVQPNDSNTGLTHYNGTLLVGHELNKLASNIGMGRNFAGIHYRTDCLEGMKLGEKIALSVLTEEGYTNNETFKGFTVTKFNGEKVVIGKRVTV